MARYINTCPESEPGAENPRGTCEKYDTPFAGTPNKNPADPVIPAGRILHEQNVTIPDAYPLTRDELYTPANNAPANQDQNPL
jgi:hypothetical protein